MGMTPQHFHTIPTSCSSCQLCTPRNSTCTQPIHTQGTHHCSLQSSIDPYLLCSAAIKFHNITYTPSYHTDHIPYIPSTAHGLHSFWIQARQTISAMLSIASKYIVHCSHPQHNPHPMHINMHSPHCLPQPSAHN